MCTWGLSFSLLLSQSLSLALRITRVEVHTVEDRRKEKSAKLLSGLKSRRDKIHQQSESRGRQSELIETIRIQMQASDIVLSAINSNCNSYLLEFWKLKFQKTQIVF